MGRPRSLDLLPVWCQPALANPKVGDRDSRVAALLIFAFAATRGGGIFPDELPFNLVQKAVRAGLKPFGVGFFELAENDERRQWQDKWYGQEEDVKLPFGMSRAPPRDIEADGAEADPQQDGEQRGRADGESL